MSQVRVDGSASQRHVDVLVTQAPLAGQDSEIRREVWRGRNLEL